jgi:hypothetical protein
MDIDLLDSLFALAPQRCVKFTMKQVTVLEQSSNIKCAAHHLFYFWVSFVRQYLDSSPWGCGVGPRQFELAQLARPFGSR